MTTKATRVNVYYGICVAVLSMVLCAFAQMPAGAAEQQRPNVLFIMVDDLGWSDVGFNGTKVYETPNVDRLARQGIHCELA